MLLSGLQLTLSKHYCGGELADAKVSVFGGEASCGMENLTGDCNQSNSKVSSNCCKNQTTIYQIDNNFNQSVADLKIATPSVLQLFIVPETSKLAEFIAHNNFNTDVSPPANKLVSDVSLPEIGVFRI